MANKRVQATLYSAPDPQRSPLAPLGGNAESSRIELLPLASLGENKEFESIPLRGTAQLRIMLIIYILLGILYLVYI
jgi:hypothetical protein